ncbi:MAG: hypothetical protein RMI01_08995 [Thermodesulfovibrio sp.]|nr:hypothetical protein [Thermodesulfovibrio sp.]
MGSLWIYRDQIVSEIETIPPGSLVKVYEEKTRKFVGTGYLNSKSLISIRLLSFKEEDINIDFLRMRIIKCRDYRENFLGLKESYRLVFGESDFLPGLIVDKYENCIVIQILTAGMENFKNSIIKIIDELFSPNTIIVRNDSQARLKEGLDKEQKKDAIEGYINLNKMAIKLLKKDGILATSSCSQHISEVEFSEIIKEALIVNKKTGILIHRGTQSKDHPILLSMPETSYLKCFILKIY